jgi:hypothetical protein
MNEAKNIQKPTKKAWIIGVVCRFFGHKYRLKKQITPYLREIKCTRCKQEFGMNDQTQSVLPLDNELRKLHATLLNNKEL